VNAAEKVKMIAAKKKIPTAGINTEKA